MGEVCSGRDRPPALSLRESAFKQILIFGAALSLTACATGRPPVEVQAKRPATHGYLNVPVAASEAGTLFGGLEGTDCEVSNSDFSTRFQTPAVVKIPLYGYTTQPLKISCQRPGYRSDPVILPPLDAEVVNSAVSRASVGAFAGSAMGFIPVVGLVAGPVGREVGKQVGIASALDDAARMPEEERRTHHFTYLPAFEKDGRDVVQVVMTRVGE